MREHNVRPPDLSSPDPRLRGLLAAAGVMTFERRWSQVEPAADDPTEWLPLPGTGARLHPDDAEPLAASLRDALASNATDWRSEYRALFADGDVAWLIVIAQIERDETTCPLAVFGVVRDVTERKRMHAEMRYWRETLRSAMSAGQLAIYNQPLPGLRLAHTQRHSRPPRSKPALEGTDWQINLGPLFGFDPEQDVSATEVFTRVHPDDLARMANEFDEAVSEGRSAVEHEYRAVLPDERVRWHHARIQVARDARGRPTRMTGVVTDISDRKAAEEQVSHVATHDALTGLPNRSLFHHMLTRAVASAQRNQRRFALMFIDLDRFKIINDTLGHEAGDLVLREIGDRLRQTLRTSDVVARLGGDEFVVLAEDVEDAQHAATIARKLIACAMLPVVLPGNVPNGQECRVTASIGVCVYPSDGEDAATLMKHADMAMYEAKREGKNTFCLFARERGEQALGRMALESQLRGALERNELTLHYQPKIGCSSNRITGVEALLRWHNPTLGQVPPVSFIPVAEDSGLIVPIGRWVMRTACQQSMAWHRRGLGDVPVAVNLSARQFMDENLYDDIVGALNDSGLPPRLLEIELTEGMVMFNIERAVELLTAIKALGVHVAIDDFGTGYSSLAQLRRFPLDKLKVDRSFVRDIQADPDGQAIAEAIIAMGKTLSLTVIAEGVETMEEADFLRGLACDEMQGYHVGRPVTAEAMVSVLQEWAGRAAA